MSKSFLTRLNSLRSSSQERFSMLPKTTVPRSQFNVSAAHKLDMYPDYLVPIYWHDVLPGETLSLSHEILGMLTNAMVAPIMDNIYLEVQYWFVPYRLIWDNWERFQGARKNPEDSIDFLIPQMNSGENGVDFRTIHDYIGVPPKVPNLDFNCMFHRAYNKIYNIWYRDQNLQDSVPEHSDDGPDPIGDYMLLKRGKRKDYFTSCLPWPQKSPDGSAVTLGLGTTAPVVGNGNAFGLTDGTVTAYEGSFITQGVWANTRWTDSGFPAVGDTPDGVNSGSTTLWGVSQDPEKSGLVADLSEATSITINRLRLAIQMQRLFERDARGGTLYSDILASHFGVISPDARLQRPEYLGGGFQRFQIQGIPQTSATDDVTPQGTLTAIGGVLDTSGKFMKSFVEHGVVLGLASIRTDLTYQQGLPRQLSYQTRYDLYMPVFAHLGEQPVLNKEIYAQGKDVVDEKGDPIDEKVFGYQERYAEYRFGFNRISGGLRSTFPQSLDKWHLAQKFDELPTLSAEFIESMMPWERMMSVTDEPPFRLMCRWKGYADLPMPANSIPGLMDHF